MPSGCVVVHELSLTITKFLCHSVAVDVSLKGEVFYGDIADEYTETRQTVSRQQIDTLILTQSITVCLIYD